MRIVSTPLALPMVLRVEAVPTGVQGEQYSCADSIFRKSCQPVESPFQVGGYWPGTAE